MSDLDKLEIFTYVAQLNNLTHAAKKLGIPKPTVSRKISLLEEELQVQLFKREKQRLKLTPEGEILLEKCICIKRDLQDVRHMFRGVHEEPEGELHIVLIGYYAKRLVFPRLKDFLQKYPKIHLRIDTTEHLLDEGSDEVDVSIGFDVPISGEKKIIQKKIAATRYVLCASPGYFEKYGEPKNLGDLLNHQYIEHSSPYKEKGLRLLPGNTIKLQPYLVVDTMSDMIECALQDLGLIQLPLFITEKFLKKGKLVETLAKLQARDATIYYYYSKESYLKPTVKTFIDFFIH